METQTISTIQATPIVIVNQGKQNKKKQVQFFNTTKEYKDFVRYCEKYGGGSVYQRNSDGRYITYYKPEKTPKPRYGNSKTEEEAYFKLYKMIEQEKQGVIHSNQKMDTLALLWLENFRRPSVKPPTYAKDYEAYINHIQPAIGALLPHQVTTLDLQQLLNSKAKIMGKTAFGRIKFILNKIFNYLKKSKVIADNPMENIELPKNLKTSDEEIYFLEEDEVQRIEKLVEQEVQKAWETNNWKRNTIARYGYIILFMINTGLRKGEVLALEWNDLLYSKKRVNVDKTLGLIANVDAKEGENKNIWHLGKPKTKTSIRLASFPAKARYYMEQLKLIQEHVGYEDKEHIARTITGEPISKSSWDNLLKRICKLCNIDKPISPHELRHTFATLCLSKGADVQVVSKRMGHSNVNQTYRYVHLVKNVEDESDNIIDNLVA